MTQLKNLQRNRENPEKKIFYIYINMSVSIIPPKRNVMIKLNLPEEKKEVVEKQVDLEPEEQEEEYIEEVVEAPSNDQLFEVVEEGLSREERPPEAPPGNIIEAEPKKKTKRKLSEKQLAHLARMRAKALAKRKKLREAKEKEKELKRIQKEKKRQEKEIEKAKKKAKKEAEKKYIQQQDEEMDKHIQSSVNTKPSVSKEDLEFDKFFNYMERYERIKNVRQRQAQRKPVATLQQPKPKNKYLGTLIPF